MNAVLLKEYAALIKTDPTIIPDVADKLSFKDAVALSYHLANQDRSALIYRYKMGFSKQPGFTYLRINRYNQTERGFIQGPISQRDADRLARGKHWDRVKLVKVGVWPAVSASSTP